MRRPIRKKITLNCSHCKKKFLKYPSQVKLNKDTVFCGNPCVIDYRKIHWKGKIDSKCRTCGKEFKFNRAELKKSKGAGSFCSRGCQANDHEILICKICKKEFKANLSDIKRNNRRYCSRKCYSKRTDPIENFFKNISKEIHPKGCWQWKGRKDRDGYGLMWIRDVIKTHRFSYEYHKGPIPKEMIICHKCDNPSCVNPSHLYAGTLQDNAKDRIDKTRHNI